MKMSFVATALAGGIVLALGSFSATAAPAGVAAATAGKAVAGEGMVAVEPVHSGRRYYRSYSHAPRYYYQPYYHSRPYSLYAPYYSYGYTYYRPKYRYRPW